MSCVTFCLSGSTPSTCEMWNTFIYFSNGIVFIISVPSSCFSFIGYIFQNTIISDFSALRIWPPNSCHCLNVAYSPFLLTLLNAPSIVPLQGFSQGIMLFSNCSIIRFVTNSYTLILIWNLLKKCFVLFVIYIIYISTNICNIH